MGSFENYLGKLFGKRAKREEEKNEYNQRAGKAVGGRQVIAPFLYVYHPIFFLPQETHKEDLYTEEIRNRASVTKGSPPMMI